MTEKLCLRGDGRPARGGDSELAEFCNHCIESARKRLAERGEISTRAAMRHYLLLQPYKLRDGSIGRAKAVEKAAAEKKSSAPEPRPDPSKRGKTADSKPRRTMPATLAGRPTDSVTSRIEAMIAEVPSVPPPVAYVDPMRVVIRAAQEHAAWLRAYTRNVVDDGAYLGDATAAWPEDFNAAYGPAPAQAA